MSVLNTNHSLFATENQRRVLVTTFHRFLKKAPTSPKICSTVRIYMSLTTPPHKSAQSGNKRIGSKRVENLEINNTAHHAGKNATISFNDTPTLFHYKKAKAVDYGMKNDSLVYLHTRFGQIRHFLHTWK